MAIASAFPIATAKNAVPTVAAANVAIVIQTRLLNVLMQTRCVNILEVNALQIKPVNISIVTRFVKTAVITATAGNAYPIATAKYAARTAAGEVAAAARKIMAVLTARVNAATRPAVRFVAPKDRYAPEQPVAPRIAREKIAAPTVVSVPAAIAK